MLSKATPKHGLGKGSNFNPKSYLLCTAIYFLKTLFYDEQKSRKKIGHVNQAVKIINL